MHGSLSIFIGELLDKEIEEDYILLALEEGFDVADFDSRPYFSFLNKNQF